MSEILLLPPIAFVLYVLLVGFLSYLGRALAGTQPRPSAVKSSPYASGEESVLSKGAPGYRQFFLVALFFAVLHLGALVLASSSLSPVACIHLLGLMMALVALTLG
jgi:NADH:ubiquinone oxidoreductase subunit 3 (subunit A)